MTEPVQPPSPYIPNTPEDQRAMLQAIGVASIDDLFADIPASHRKPRLALPAPLSEQELLDELRSLAAQNADAQRYACFLGAGAYRHFVPSIVGHITSRSELATSYTPYQPELSQGVLQATYEFQSLLCQLTEMEVANSGMYDGASALAEAALMACRITGRYSVVALDTVNPRYLAAVRSYLSGQNIGLRTVPPTEVSLGQEDACLLAQSPNFFGYLEEMPLLSDQAHRAGALLVAAFDPISLGKFAPPGSYDADIAVGEGQPLGNALNFGGPYLGLFACKAKYLRQMPGRIAGRTVDTKGRTGYVLTLQTREQHIRRERATSNICTTESLMALAATVYLAALGKHGLRQVAELCYHKAHYAAQRIAALPGYRLPMQGVFFKEFVAQCPVAPARLNRALLRKGILGGLDVSDRISNGMLLCVTETNTRQQIDQLAEVLPSIRPELRPR